MRTSLLTYFTSFYGIICLGVTIYSRVFEVHLNIDSRDFLELIILSTIYAVVRCKMDSTYTVKKDDLDVVKIDPMYAKFLNEEESRKHIDRKKLIPLFYKWKDEQS